MVVVRKPDVEYEPVSSGSHHAVCYAVIDLGVQYNATYEKNVPKIRIMWELVNELTEFDGEEKRRVLSKEYTRSLGERSHLRKDLENWRGKAFSDEELLGFDLAHILGKNCLLTVIHDTGKNGNTYANVSGISGLPRGMDEVENENELINFDLDDNAKNVKANMAKLPEWVQKYIEKSQTYIDLMGGAPPKEDEPKKEEKAKEAPKTGSSRATKKSESRTSAF